MSMKLYLTIGIIVVTALIICWVAASTAITVESGFAGVLLTSGSADANYKAPGLHFVIPGYQKVVPINTKILPTEVAVTAASKDLQSVTGTIVVTHRLLPENVVKVYTTVGMSYPTSLIVPTVQESAKQVTAKYTADDLIQQRDKVKNEILQLVSHRLNQN